MGRWTKNGVNPEFGYHYDNETEFYQLVREMNQIASGNVEMINIMTFLQSEIEIAKNQIANPTRNPEEQNFYSHIRGINSYIRETKTRDKANGHDYVYDNIGEAEGLLSRLVELNTQDPDILAIMDSITKDIKMVISSRSGLEVAAQYQERLDNLNIGREGQQRKK